MTATQARYKRLDEEACLRLLGTAKVGRIGFVRRGSPDVLPVNYVLADGAIVFATAGGSKVDGATRGPVVFEIDHVDEEERSGWSVVVHGQAQTIEKYDEPELVSRMRDLEIDSWVPGPHPVVVRITPTFITGRQIG